MNESQWESYLADAVASVQARNGLLQTRHGIGDFARWDHDGTSGALTFSDPGADAILVAETTDLGSYSLETKTWLWAWANESLSDARRARAATLRSLAASTGMRLFDDSHFDCDEFLAWELAAVGARHLDAVGLYRGPSAHLWIFWAIDRVADSTR